MIDKPGPQLDAMIIRKLYGLEVTHNYNNAGPWAVASESAADKYEKDHPNGPPIPVLPPFSTTWDGMGLVVEEMQRRGWDYAIESDGSNKHARFFRRIEGNYAEYDSDLSAPHAVCMASLKALEDSQNE